MTALPQDVVADLRRRNAELEEQLQASTDENARLLNEAREALERQTATAHILKVISRSPDSLQPVLDVIVETSRELCKAITSVIFLISDGKFRDVAESSVKPEYIEALRAHPISPDQPGSVLARAARERRTVHVPNTAQDPEAGLGGPIDSGGPRSILAAPLIRDGKVMGGIVLRRSHLTPFTRQQIEAVETFADQAVIAIENARLFNETTEALARQTATSEILRVISQSPTDVRPVFEAIVAAAVKLLRCDTAVLLRCDGPTYSPVAAATPAGPLTDAGPSNLPVDPTTNFPSRAIVAKTMLHLPDWSRIELPEHERRIRDLFGVNSALFLPLLRDEVCIGVLALARKQAGAFGDNEIALAESFRDQALIAIENTRLFNETREALERQTATADILRVIASSPTDVGPVLKAIVENACELCDAYDAAVLLRDGDDLRFSAHHGPIAFNLEKWPINRNWTAGRAVVDRKPVHVRDLLNDEDFPEGRALAQRMGHRSILSVPLLREDESIGAIVLRRLEVQPFSEKQIALLQTFADQAVIAIQNVKLFDEVQAKTRDLEEALKYQTGSANILDVIASSPTDVQPVLKAIVESACELCGAYDAVVRLKIGDDLQFSAHHGPIPVTSKSLPIDLNSTAGRAVIERRAIHIHDLLTSEGNSFPEAQERARRFGHRTILSIPLVRESESIGAIILRRTEVNPFSDKQIALLQTFADQAVIALGNVRLFDEVQARTRELAQSLDELRSTQDRLIQTEKLASLGQLTAGIAHEIKNPLNFINNFSALSTELIDELNDVLKPGAIDGKTRAEIDELTQTLKANLEKVVQHGKRADSIVKNMLLHSREGSGEHRLTDINTIVEESLNLAYHGARAEKPGFNITLKCDLDPNAGMVDVYPQEITRVLLNLISNGFYAATKRRQAEGAGFESMLSASTKNAGDRVEVRIRDNGAGIPNEVREKIFNPFFTTKPAGEGTGLGLSMSHDIVVKQHGGKIEVATEPGEFTELIITLPRKLAAQANSLGDRN